MKRYYLWRIYSRSNAYYSLSQRKWYDDIEQGIKDFERFKKKDNTISMALFSYDIDTKVSEFTKYEYKW